MLTNQTSICHTPTIGKATFDFGDSSRLFYEGVDITEIVQEKANTIKKKMYDNRGCFNDFLEYWVNNASVH